MQHRVIVRPTRLQVVAQVNGKPEFTMRQLMNWLELPVEYRTRAEETKIGTILHALGYSRKRRTTGRRGYFYFHASNLAQ